MNIFWSYIQEASLWWRETHFSKVPSLPSRPRLCSADLLPTLPTPRGSCSSWPLLGLPHPCLLYTLICELSPMRHLRDSHPWVLSYTHHFCSVHLPQKGCLWTTLIFPERPSAHTRILLKTCPMGHLPSATFFSLWLVLHCFLLAHGSQASLPFNIHPEVGERMRNRNTWEKRLIVRIGASHYGDQEVLLSSRGKLETQEMGGCCNSD